MNWLRNVPIKKKLLWVMIPVLGAVLGLGGGAVLTYELIAVRQVGRAGLATLADVIGANSAAALTLGDAPAAQKVLDSLQSAPAIVAAATYTSQGRVLARYVRDAAPEQVLPESTLAPREKYDGNGWQIVREVTVAGQKVGEIYLRSDLQLHRHRMRAYTVAMIGITLIVAVTILFFAAEVQRLIADPILDLTRVAQAITKGKRYSLRMPKRSPDEIGLLAEAFNQMLVQVEAREQTLQQELTERRAMEELVAASRDFHLKLLDEFPSPIWRSGRDAKCDYFNKAWLKFTGRTLAQESGDGWTAGVHPEDLEHCLKTYQAAFRAQVPFAMEYRLRQASGEYAWILDSGSPYYDLDEQFAGYIGSCVDLTARKRAEETLHESEKRFVTFMENMPGFAWIKDPEGRFVFLSPARAALSLHPQDWRGRTDAELWPPAMAAHYVANHQRVIRTHQALQIIEPYDSNGKQCYGIVSMFPILDGRGEVAFVGGISVDITDRLEAEQESARLLKQLHEANAGFRCLARRVLTAQEDERRRVSRELHDEAGQALTALKMWLVALRDEAPAGLSGLRQRLTEAAQLADQTMNRIRALAQDLRPPALETLSLDDCLRGYCGEFTHRTALPVEYRGGELPALPDTVKICLYRVVQEALTNVVKHAQAGQVRIELRHEHGQVCLEVRDDGKGFVDRPGSAAGVGLLGMQERLGLLGGRLEIDTQPGNGTRLMVYIPTETGA